MKTPISDFIKKYAESSAFRLHMPGHKGKDFLGIERHDITEIDGADSLYHANGIIKESEQNASELFGTGATFYSCEGSSLSIRAMLYLAKLYSGEDGGYILAGRNAHSSFLSASALIGFDIEWIYPESEESYLSCSLNGERLEKIISDREKKPFAVYLTSPDYLGNISDVESVAAVCRKYSILLLVDNAHGAYLKFLEKSEHPIDLGADMCCDSAHKTLPVLTGGSYLHISKNAPDLLAQNAKDALALFGSTSPSYLILESLDNANLYLSDGYKQKLACASKIIDGLKRNLISAGFELFGNEKMKLSVKTRSVGYSGYELAQHLKKEGIICEFADPDFVVLMFSAENADEASLAIKKALSQVEKREPVSILVPIIAPPEICMTPREAIFAKKETVALSKALGRVFAGSNITCPPAVSLIVAGERINDSVIEACKYYGVEHCIVAKE